MADYIVTARFEDQTSAGASAAAGALDKYAQAGDKATAAGTRIETSVTRVTKSADALARSLLPAERAAAALDKAQREAAAGAATMAAAVAAGTKTQEQAAAVTGALNDRVRAARDAIAQIGTVHTSASAATDKHAISAGQLAYANKQLAMQTQDAVFSIASGIPVMQTLIQQGGQVVGVYGGFGAAARGIVSAIGPANLAVAAAVAVTAGLAIAAESSDRALLGLSARLRATRDDYAAVAQAVDSVAKRVAATSGLSVGDARTAGQTIAAVPQFSGSRADLEDMVRLSEQVAAAFGEELPAAAGRVAAAMKSPKDALQGFADQGVRGASQSLVDLAARLQDSGRLAEAQAVTLGVLRHATDGAADAVTPFQRSLRDLGNAFSTGTDGAESFAHAVGRNIAEAAAKGIDALSALLRILNQVYAAGPRADAARGAVPPASAMLAPDATGRSPLLGPVIPGSDERAVGMFQILPSTARGLGINPALQDQNIFGGLAYLQKLTQERGGVDGALAQYGGYGRDVGRAAGYIGRVQGANIAALPADVAAQIEYWGQVLGMTPDMIALGQRLAMVESGGRQYASGTAAPGPVPGAPPAGAADPTANAAYGSNQGLMDQALKAAGQTGSIGQTRDKLADTLDLLQKAQAIARTGSADWQMLQGAIEKTQAAISGTRDPIDSLIKGLRDSTAPLVAAEGAARALAEADVQLRNAEEQAGRTATAGERYEVQAQALAKLSAALADSLARIDRQVAGERALGAALDAGAASTAGAANRVRALEEARQVAVPGTREYAQAVDALAAKYDKLTAAQVDNQSRTTSADYRRQLEVLETEARLINAAADARAREVAILQERQRILRSGGDPNTEPSRAAIALAGDVAAANANLQEQRQILQEVGNLAVQAFDQVGQAVANAFATGKAVQWGGVMRSVLSSVLQEVLKLGAINPILNSVLGGSRATLSSAFSAISNAGGGGSGGGFSLPNINLSSLYDSFSNFSFSSMFTSPFASSLGSTNAAIAASVPGGYGPATAGAFEAAGGAGTTLGGYASGLGLGFGAGSFVGGLINPNHSQQAQIGAGLGAAIGSIWGPVGGLVGGLIGGVGGSFFGPGPAHHGYSWQIQGNGADGLSLGSRVFVDPIAQQQFDAEMQQMAEVNKYLKANGVSVSGLFEVGGTAPGMGGRNDRQVDNFAQGVGRLSFSSDDSTLNTALGSGKITGLEELQTAVEFVKGYKALLDSEKNIGAVQAAVDGLNKSFNDAIETARGYGLATDELAAMQAKQVAEVQQKAAQAVADTETGYRARSLAAGGDSTGANLLLFDVRAAQEQLALVKQLTDAYGDAYKATTDYARITGELSDALAAERLAVADQQRQAAAGSLAGTVASLAAYAESLAVGGASPLSAQDQLALAGRQFDAVAGAARAGDGNSLAQLQGYSDRYLATARGLYGSGAEYVAVFGRVADALEAVGNTSGDTLTASVMQAATQKQTDVLAAKLDALKAAVDALRQQQAQNALAPARVAA